jgi:hypothetical protein
VHDETDETIIRIAAALRLLPEVDPAQKARVLVAVAAERERARARRARIARAWRIVGGASFAAGAALVAAVWLRAPRGGTEVAARGRSAGAAPAPTVADSAAENARLTSDAQTAGYKSVQVVFRAPAATHVSVVGDFNAWDTHSDAMSRDPVTGLWSHTLALRPGRHVYAFVVDGGKWTLDPRAPRTRDSDFGTEQSVMIVGLP